MPRDVSPESGSTRLITASTAARADGNGSGFALGDEGDLPLRCPQHDRVGFRDPRKECDIERVHHPVALEQKCGRAGRAHAKRSYDEDGDKQARSHRPPPPQASLRCSGGAHFPSMRGCRAPRDPAAPPAPGA